MAIECTGKSLRQGRSHFRSRSRNVRLVPASAGPFCGEKGHPRLENGPLCSRSTIAPQFFVYLRLPFIALGWGMSDE
jgi:hypothetical protein